MFVGFCVVWWVVLTFLFFAICMVWDREISKWMSWKWKLIILWDGLKLWLKE